MRPRREGYDTPALFPLTPLVRAVGVADLAANPRPGADGSDLAGWARGRSRRRAAIGTEGLRFAFYWRVSTEDHQDPVSSREWQLGRAEATIVGAGRIVAEYSDIGRSRSVAWPNRPGAAALLAAVRDPGRGFDAVVIGSHERAFFDNQFSHVGPVLVEAGVQLWLPEVGGALDASINDLNELMTLLGILSKREIIRARARAKGAMSAQVRLQGRRVGGRVPYGYRLVDAGPHPNKADARWGPPRTRARSWAGSSSRGWLGSVARITRALNEVGITCPSAADPANNPHRSGAAWIVRTVQEILANPVYTGHMVWNRVRTDRVLVDPDNPGLGQREVVRWNAPEDWVISEHVVHTALVSEADFIAAQGLCAARADAQHEYALAGLLRCALCGRALESHWVHGTPGYRCRHGHTRAKNADPGRPKNAYLPEKAVLAKLPLLFHRLTATSPTAAMKGRGASAAASPIPASPEEVIDHLRGCGLVLCYDSRTRTLETGSGYPVRVTV
jgi:site-specific DNA recombinase